MKIGYEIARARWTLALCVLLCIVAILSFPSFAQQYEILPEDIKPEAVADYQAVMRNARAVFDEFQRNDNIALVVGAAALYNCNAAHKADATLSALDKEYHEHIGKRLAQKGGDLSAWYAAQAMQHGYIKGTIDAVRLAVPQAEKEAICARLEK